MEAVTGEVFYFVNGSIGPDGDDSVPKSDSVNNVASNAG
jgi:hypothetical protein